MADSDSDSAVEEIISQAMDLHVLEQISSINLSGVTATDLPTDLETRFRKLKSFPQTNLKTHIPLSPQLNSHKNDLPTTSIPSITIPTSSPNWEEEDFKPTPTKPKNGDGYLSSSSSSEEEKDSSLPSSPRQTLCFFCSPSSKKVSKTKTKNKKKKKKKDKSRVDDFDSFGSDLMKFSLKEHKRSLKKALKEQDKIAQETEEVVNLAKQLSARIEDFVIHNDKFK